MSQRGRQAGVSLIEVLISMAIMGILMTLVYGGFVQTANNKRRVEQRLDRNHEVTMGIDRIARELSMAFVSAQINADPTLQAMLTAFVVSEKGNSSRIDFTSFSHMRLYRDAHESDENELSYFVADHPDDPSRKVLARREQRRIDDKPLEGGEVQILIEDVEEFHIEVLDPQTLEWTGTWDTTQAAMQPNRLPLQVRFTLTVPDWQGSGRDQTFGTRVNLPIQYALNFAIYQQ